MFNLFRKKDAAGKLTNKILMTQSAKWKALETLCLKEPGVILIFWFEDTLQQALKAMNPDSTVSENFYLANRVHEAEISNKKVVFAEHHPLAYREISLFEKLQLTHAEIWSAMDEPLFKEFGSDKIVQMMKQLGIKEDEIIEHSMITDSIHKAQIKIEKKVTSEQQATSQEEWLLKNWRTS